MLKFSPHLKSLFVLVLLLGACSKIRSEPVGGVSSFKKITNYRVFETATREAARAEAHQTLLEMGFEQMESAPAEPSVEVFVKKPSAGDVIVYEISDFLLDAAKIAMRAGRRTAPGSSDYDVDWAYLRIEPVDSSKTSVGIEFTRSTAAIAAFHAPHSVFARSIPEPVGPFFDKLSLSLGSSVKTESSSSHGASTDSASYKAPVVPTPPLDVKLPACNTEFRRTTAPISLLVLVDKSKSMRKEEKIERARDAIIALAEALRPKDRFSVVAFDSAPFHILRFDTIEKQRALTRKRLMNIFASGQADLVTSLEYAGKHLGFENTERRHILLIGDNVHGLVDDSKLTELVKSYCQQRISVSTIQLGEDGTGNLFSELAKATAGRNYPIADLTRLRQTVLQERSRVTATK